MYETCTTDLFNPTTAKIPPKLNGEFSLIPIEKLISLRSRAAFLHSKDTYFLEERRPEEFTDYLPALYDDQDDEYKFRLEIQSRSIFNKPLKIHSDGVEFANLTYLTPGKLSRLSKAAKAAAAKKKLVANYLERIERSKVGKFRASGVLGNTGNNLANFEKPAREKRYRIQKSIQVERLACNTVCTCGQPISDYVHLKKNTEFGNINVQSVATCGSVWACPVCRAKIVNERAKELDLIYKKGKEKEWEFHLITFTVPHNKFDNLAELYGSSTLGTGLSGAFTKFRQSRTWSKELKKQIGFIGDIKSVEVTWGFNGFHPHIHLILISEHRFDQDKWKNKIFKQWVRSCKKAGLEAPSEEHGVKIDYVQSAEMVTYLSKWSVGSELSSDAAKEGRAGNFSISELELMLIDGKLRAKKKMRLDRIAAVLKAYYAAMKGQKQLQYGGLNTGWKKELGLDEIDDAGISDEEFQDKKEFNVCVFDKHLYQDIRRNGILSEIIQAVEPIEYNIPNYSSIVTAKIKNILFLKGYDLETKVWNSEEFHENGQKHELSKKEKLYFSPGRENSGRPVLEVPGN